MSLASLSSAQLRHLLQLIKEKEAIQTKLAKVNLSLKALEMKVKDLANSIGAKLGSVSVWFYTTAKKVKGIQKVGESKFSYRP
jgi:K+/H+ antiporter YhaU regulatory subunit KhtT